MNNLRRTVNSSNGTHSWIEPRAIPKELRRSGFVKRPLPSAILAAIDSSIELIAKKAIPAWEVFGYCTNLVGEVDGFLIDDQLLEGERHEVSPHDGRK